MGTFEGLLQEHPCVSSLTGAPVDSENFQNLPFLLGLVGIIVGETGKINALVLKQAQAACLKNG